MTHADINAIGYVAQGLFSSRFIVQWISSEKAKKVVAPTLFWQISLIASFLLIVYAVLAKDFSVLLGQVIGYLIYIRNLRLQREWRKLPFMLRQLIALSPAIAIIILLFDGNFDFTEFWKGQKTNLVVMWGLIGQFLFSCRFIYQWYFSEKVKKSVLPLGFWLISIGGSLLIASYAIYEELYPIMIGHTFGMVIYGRNVMIYFNRKKIQKRKRK
jgi:lipid-A-disaccharide synthase-like uncharacterized protein